MPCYGQKRYTYTVKKYLLVILAVIALLSVAIFVWKGNATAPATPQKAQPKANISTNDPVPQQFNKQQYSISDPTSIWIVVDKLRILNPKTYAPSDLVVPNIPLRSNITSTEKYVRAETAEALQKMASSAAKEGITLNLQSGYRSYEFQVSLYGSYVSNDGQAKADTYSARPGYSEHQTGWAADLGGTTNPGCNVEECYANTPEGKWLAVHAWEYGFIIRYPQGLTEVTGYTYEPWHVRYIGTELSGEMHKQGILTLEQFFGLPNAPTYN